MTRHSEVNSTGAPTTIDHIIGQTKVVEQVRVALEASWTDGSRLCHMLLTGAPGLGKTLLATVLAAELGSKLRQVLAQTLYCASDLHGLLAEADDRDVIVIDEADELDPLMQTQLYRALEDGCLFLPSSERRRRPYQVRLSSFTLLCCSNHEGSLVQPLRDRFRMILRFDFYTEDELSALLKQRLHQLDWQVSDEGVLQSIARLGRGTPRVALRLLESCWRLARSRNEDIITPEIFDSNCKLLEIDSEVGLDRIERQYLEILSESDKPTRLQTLSRRLGVPPKSLSTVIEAFLVRAGLVATGDAGRKLTARGMHYLQSVAVQSGQSG